MMSEQDLADVVQIAVEDLSPDHPVVLENHVVTDEDEPALKRQRLEINCQDPSIKSFLYSINQTICLRLDSIEAKLQALEATCKSLEEKLDLVTNKQHSPIQVPMVAGSPLGATQTCNKVRCVVPQTTVILNNDRQNAIVAKMEDPLSNRAPDSLENIISNAVPGRRQNTIVVKVPGQDDSHYEDGESGSGASGPVGQPGSQSIGSNVTLITLNSEEDYPNGTWLGDENNPEMRVRCAIIPSDMLHISTNCRTAEKMALTLLDYLFHREVQAVSNLSGQGKHGKKQLDPLTIYGIRCKWVTFSINLESRSLTGIESNRALTPNAGQHGGENSEARAWRSRASRAGLRPRPRTVPCGLWSRGRVCSDPPLLLPWSS
uniref:Protein BANP n=1 Tax=Spermophilus dauricus TaxID=99837 RepID=A0A8C9PH36_SPEDA